MILVTGSAGKTGKALIKALTLRGQSVRAFVHLPVQEPLIKSLGAEEVVVGDLRDSATMESAVHGVRAVYHIAPNASEDEFRIGKTVIQASITEQVEHFVYHSVLHPHLESMPHHWLKSRVEEVLIQSGLVYSILQPTVYMQNMLAGLENIKNGKYTIPYLADTRISLVDLEDVAESAAIVLTQPSHQYETIELVGTPPYSQQEISKKLGIHLGHAVSVETINLDTWDANARKVGMGDYAIDTLKKMFLYYDTHGFTGNRNALTKLLGRPPTTIDAFIKRTI